MRVSPKSYPTALLRENPATTPILAVSSFNLIKCDVFTVPVTVISVSFAVPHFYIKNF